MAIETEHGTLEFDGEDGTALEQAQRRARSLFSVTAGTMPMDRDFGISAEYLGRPMSLAKDFYSAEVEEKVEAYLPGCEVEDVTFEGGPGGELYPHVTLAVDEDYDEDEDDDEDAWDEAGEEDEDE